MDQMPLASVLSQPFALPAALLFLGCVPLVLGLVPRNRWYGVRTRRTLAGDRTWYEVNRVGGAAIMLASLAYALVAAALPYARTADGDFGRWAVHLAAFVLPLLVAAAATVFYARRRNG